MAAPVLLHGFSSLKDVLAQRVTGDLIPTVETAVAQSIADHNEVTKRMIELFVTRITAHQIRYKSPVAAKLQPLDEFGRARKIKMAGYYDVGFPIKSAGSAFGHTREARIKMTVKDFNDSLTLMLDADLRWQRDQIMSALFTNTSYTFGDEEFGNVTVMPLANGDTQVYLIRAGAEAGEASVQHFRAQAANLADATNPYPTIYRDLTKRPENSSGKVVSFIPANLRDEVEGLATFKEASDPDIRLADNKDELIGALGISVPGEVVGKVGKVWVVEWDALPDDYTINIATGGDKPLAMREHAEPELQGFSAVADRADHPYFERQFVRSAGFGAWNRVAAIVQRFNNGAYAAPTGLSQPQA